MMLVRSEQLSRKSTQPPQIIAMAPASFLFVTLIVLQSFFQSLHSECVSVWVCECVSVCVCECECVCVSIRTRFFSFSNCMIFDCRAAIVIACVSTILLLDAQSSSNWPLARRVLLCCCFSSRNIFRTRINSASSSPQITLITSRLFSKSDMEVAEAAAVLARFCIFTAAAASCFLDLDNCCNSRLLHIQVNTFMRCAV